jgi:hypothetical protein
VILVVEDVDEIVEEVDVVVVDETKGTRELP